MASYDTGYFSLKRYYRTWLLEHSGAISLLLKARHHSCAESVATAEQRKTFIDLAAFYMKRLKHSKSKKLNLGFE